jgi:glycosyltransferase involved in cell wall biosynthesis
MKILLVHQHYLFANQPGGSRFNEMVRLWTRAGHQVEVIAGTVNYATGFRPSRYQGKWITRDDEESATVWRCYVSPAYNDGFLGRMWAILAFTLSASSAVLKATRPDVVLATSPPLTVAITGWLASRWFRVPLVFEVRDLWPESAVTTGVLRQSSLMTRVLYWLERQAYRRSALIGVLTPAFRDDIVGRGLAPPEKIVLVPNGADTEQFEPRSRYNSVRRDLGWGDRIVALYAGVHGRANAIGQLVDAADRLRHRADILIATVGDGPERERWAGEARRRNLTNIQFCGPLPKDAMPDAINAADIGIAVLQRNPTFRTVYPNKMFDYMACARPTVLAVDGVARALMCDEAHAGVYVQPENAEALAAAISALADDEGERARLGHNGRTWVTANATRESLAHRYASHLERVSQITRRPSSGADDGQRSHVPAHR